MCPLSCPIFLPSEGLGVRRRAWHRRPPPATRRPRPHQAPARPLGPHPAPQAPLRRPPRLPVPAPRPRPPLRTGVSSPPPPLPQIPHPCPSPPVRACDGRIFVSGTGGGLRHMAGVSLPDVILGTAAAKRGTVQGRRAAGQLEGPRPHALSSAHGADGAGLHEGRGPGSGTAFCFQ